MYRLLLIVVIHAAAPAPQSIDSDVTYIKIQPVVGHRMNSATNFRESRIEKLPLTIPGNITAKENDNNSELPTEESKVEFENLADLTESESEIAEVLDDQHSAVSPTIQTYLDDEDKATTVLLNPDTKSSIELGNSALSELEPENSAPLDLSPIITEPNGSTEHYHDLPASDSDTISDILPLETQSDRQARNFDSAETTEPAETTEKIEIDRVVEITTKTPKFVSKAKSSYFQKPRVFENYSPNLVENAPKRRFRSRCRCEKIWNCPKLQISVPRCPNEYFLCCF